MLDKYGVAQDRYCYPDSDVLKNLLDIRDADLLAEAEAEFTAERNRTYETPKYGIWFYRNSYQIAKNLQTLARRTLPALF